MSTSRKRRSRSRRTTADVFNAAVSGRLRRALGDRPPVELARVAECSPASVRRYLSGASAPTVAFVIAVGVAYNISVQWLLTGKGRVRHYGGPRRS